MLLMLIQGHYQSDKANIMAGVSTLTSIPAFLLFIFLRHSVCTYDDPSLFPGHLEPLGARHNKSSVKTLFAFPAPREFFQNFASASFPLLIKGGAKLSPAFTKWTDDYFSSVAGSESFSIDVENGKKENRTKGDLQRMSFKQFVESYRDQDVYMVNGVPDFIQ